jgi:hypothetical protein
MKTRFVLIPLALSAAFLSVARAAPSDDMSRVEVTGQNTYVERYDIRHACPLIDTSLSNSLSNSWFHEQPVGEMIVHFKLDGHAVSEVKTQGFNVSYQQTRRAVRKAVTHLDCAGDGAGAQAYAFKIMFIAPTDENGGQRFAVSEMHVASKGE